MTGLNSLKDIITNVKSKIFPKSNVINQTTYNSSSEGSEDPYLHVAKKDINVRDGDESSDQSSDIVYYGIAENNRVNMSIDDVAESCGNEDDKLNKVVEDIKKRLTNPSEGFNHDIRHIKITPNELELIINKMEKILITENNLLKLGKKDEKYCIFGDVHGQYWDMVSQLQMTKDQVSTNLKYIFLGDLVDRGTFSLEILLHLSCWKISDPSNVYIIRGNHETEPINTRLGFRKEMITIFGEKTGTKLWTLINEKIFRNLSLGAVLYDKYFLCHGGISDQLLSLDQITKISKPYTCGVEGTLVNDILWSDPNIKNPIVDFDRNDGRSLKYGTNSTERFLQRNGLTAVIRAHQVAHNGVFTGFQRRVVSVFSAPRYNNKLSNPTGVLITDGANMDAIIMKRGKIDFTKIENICPTKLSVTEQINIF